MLTIENPRTFDWAGISLADCCEGNAFDVHFTLKLFNMLEEKLEELGMRDMFEKVISKSLPIFAQIEYDGLDVDTNVLSVLGDQLRLKNIDQEDALYSCPGVLSTDNMSSNHHLIEILYTRDGALELYPPDKTTKGSPSVSAPTLKLLLEHINKELSTRDV